MARKRLSGTREGRLKAGKEARLLCDAEPGASSPFPCKVGIRFAVDSIPPGSSHVDSSKSADKCLERYPASVDDLKACIKGADFMALELKHLPIGLAGRKKRRR